uniref:Uncharacterized protein n=1 Tax=Trichogramma kaykai TaxID=54128 RepID=A0ABD2W2C5_9HYME
MILDWAPLSSSTVTAGTSYPARRGSWKASPLGTRENRAATAPRTRRGEPGCLACGHRRRDMAILYGLPHMSLSTSSQSCLQHRRLLVLIAARSRVRRRSSRCGLLRPADYAISGRVCEPAGKSVEDQRSPPSTSTPARDSGVGLPWSWRHRMRR